jgi:hypothetical protein
MFTAEALLGLQIVVGALAVIIVLTSERRGV